MENMSTEIDDWVSIVDGETYNAERLRRGGVGPEVVKDLVDFHGLKSLGRGVSVYKGGEVIESLERMDRGEIVLSVGVKLKRDELRKIKKIITGYMSEPKK